ncbi:hypothetical protein GCM10010329_26550 [Streptomyces spiroverticillatus]|uniref:Phosphodiester glycosidase domain-containing protein n=1 Tax=Streptomyces finlayi TaxID=67296 RepID=A0A919C8Y1_9ACTN|nr:phosphodiester glycosidase family protein [Streptomyces finlayi]GHA03054.1 hypothetical protein GCM10010329_26550 [Streptomyces spiroverticillatus]GHC87248.1 hypothetical protein GCM10010334_18960 [Streptomyces finlayi]
MAASRRGFLGAALGGVPALALLRGDGARRPGRLGDLPLGSPGTRTEVRRHRRLAPGVDYWRLAHGYAAGHWTVGVRTSGEVSPDRADAAELRAALDRRGFDSYVKDLCVPATQDAPGGVVGHAVQSGRLDRKADAQALRRRLTAAGFRALLTHTDALGGPSEGPWDIHVLHLARDSGLSVRPVPGLRAPEPETVRATAERTSATAAVNGMFFRPMTGPGARGVEPRGLYVSDHRLLHDAPVGGTALVRAGGHRAYEVTELRTRTTVTAPSGAQHPVSGVNSSPGRGGDLTLLTPGPGGRPLGGDGPNGISVGLGPQGQVLSRHHGPAPRIPEGGALLRGSGGAAQWLVDHARPGRDLTVATSLLDTRAGTVRSGIQWAVGGRPALVRSGEVYLNPAANGLAPAGGPVPVPVLLRREPRTAVGITQDGGLLIVVTDGRAPRTSVGATLHETAAVMRALGAVEAVNLDGGGSSTMLVQGETVNRPRAEWGGRVVERPVANALVIGR